MDGTSRGVTGAITPSRTVSQPRVGHRAGPLGWGRTRAADSSRLYDERVDGPVGAGCRLQLRALPCVDSAPATHPCTAAWRGESLVRPHPSSRSRRLATAPAALLKGCRLPLDGGEPVRVHGSEDLALQSDSRWGRIGPRWRCPHRPSMSYRSVGCVNEPTRHERTFRSTTLVRWTIRSRPVPAHGPSRERLGRCPGRRGFGPRGALVRRQEMRRNATSGNLDVRRDCRRIGLTPNRVLPGVP